MVTAPHSGGRKQEQPFERFMYAVLDLYHQEKITDPKELGLRAQTLLAAETRPELPEGTHSATRAKELVKQVDETGGIAPERPMRWLIEALALWPDCAEAYMWVSNIMEGRREAPLLMQPFYLLAVGALRRRLELPDDGASGPLPDTADAALYGRALRAVGEALASTRLYEEALRYYREALVAFPADEELARPRMALALLGLDRIDDADDELAACGDGTLVRFAGTLATFAREGDSGRAREALRAARHANPYVTSFVTGSRRWTGFLTGDPAIDEAALITLALAPAFSHDGRMIPWIRKSVGGSVGPGPSSRRHGRRR